MSNNYILKILAQEKLEYVFENPEHEDCVTKKVITLKINKHVRHCYTTHIFMHYQTLLFIVLLFAMRSYSL